MNKYKAMLSELDCYLFGLGRHYEIYEKLGAHPTKVNGINGVYFSVWAPNAQAVYVIGDFNHWGCDSNPMKLIEGCGIWELFVPEAKIGQMYKFAIYTWDDRILFKSDPYANESEMRPGTASVITKLSFNWTDEKWIKKRIHRADREVPISIYEVHLGSWKRNNSSGEQVFYTYRELADSLSAYVKEMGYTHIELMGIAEYPYDGSWGYQVTGYYAPTARYGTPSDFMYFINKMHMEGIGVILDWVPAHFPKDSHGLFEFDGEPLYEYSDPLKGEHPQWGTKIFDFGRNQVMNFLIADALFWVEKYHLDGLRVDAVASMIYLDYGKSYGQWTPNEVGGHENKEAVELLLHLNSIMTKRNPGVLMIAEESTTWPRVTNRVEDGGLGFTYKWNMGWMHDFIEYLKLDPANRKIHHNKLTFSLTYAFSEKYMLVLSHDEVVHLKGSMLTKLPGSIDDKFKTLKVAYAFMFGHPGKKLIFMGQEFGQWSEWNEDSQLEWKLLELKSHFKLKQYVADLLHIYKKYSAFYELDQNWEGFCWVNCDDKEHSVFTFIRRNKKRKNSLLFICNFSPAEQLNYQVGVPSMGKYELILDSENGLYKKGKERIIVSSVDVSSDNMSYSLSLQLSGYGVQIYKFNES